MDNFYSTPFYEWHRLGSRTSAEVVLPIIFELIKPNSVVDVGCGTGTWLAVAKALGGRALVGYEGNWIKKATWAEPGLDIRIGDLEKPLQMDRKFDLAICMEVAEHLSHARSASLIADLCALSDCILFSAAIPGQGGANHINEQWQSYWAALFDQNCFAMLDIIRPAIWNNSSVEWWYRQNTFLYVERSRLKELNNLPAPQSIVDIAHPELVAAQSKERSIRMIISELRRAMTKTIKARLFRPSRA
jgi:SAM-dependent methyltransferase